MSTVINTVEFRKNVKKYLDIALTGEMVVIERGGIYFEIHVKMPQHRPE